jgi:serine protease Do
MSTRKTTLFYAVLIAVASAAIGMVIASRLDMSAPSAAQPLVLPAANSTPLGGPIHADTFREIAKTQMPMVVNIRTQQRRQTRELTEFFGGEDLFRRFFGQPELRRRPREEVMQGAGTGFIIDKSGLVLTHNHVIDGATRIEVAFFGDQDEYYDAKVLGRDPLTDSALLELVQKPRFEMSVAHLGDSDIIEPGDWVMAIGNPFNYAHTVTVGVISAKGRPFQVTQGRQQQVLQTDAAINPGNSGGPLLNLRGEVVGINTAILGSRMAAGNLGIGFAVPINAVREVLPQLREGKVTRGRIGVFLSPQVTRRDLQEMGAPEGRGALVAQVERGGPGDKGGIRPGDIVVEFNGEPVQNNDDLVNRVVRTAPGTSVPVKVLRGKSTESLTVRVDELDLESEGQQAQRDTGPEGTTGFGMSLQDLTPEIARQLRVPSATTGALVVDVEPNSPAQRAGLQPSDVLIQVNRREVASVTDAVRELQRVESGQIASLLVLREGAEVFATVRRE